MNERMLPGAPRARHVDHDKVPLHSNQGSHDSIQQLYVI